MVRGLADIEITQFFDHQMMSSTIAYGVVYCFMWRLASDAAQEQLRNHGGASMMQFLTSWPVLMAVAMAILALAFLIEPAIPARPDGSFAEVAELTF
jgi:hypothetical protein